MEKSNTSYYVIVEVICYMISRSIHEVHIFWTKMETDSMGLFGSHKLVKENEQFFVKLYPDSSTELLSLR